MCKAFQKHWITLTQAEQVLADAQLSLWPGCGCWAPTGAQSAQVIDQKTALAPLLMQE